LASASNRSKKSSWVWTRSAFGLGKSRSTILTTVKRKSKGGDPINFLARLMAFRSVVNRIAFKARGVIEKSSPAVLRSAGRDFAQSFTARTDAPSLRRSVTRMIQGFPIIGAPSMACSPALMFREVFELFPRHLDEPDPEFVADLGALDLLPEIIEQFPDRSDDDGAAAGILRHEGESQDLAGRE
jgi:hypothetical protein